MVLARPQELAFNLGKLFIIPFFIVHFGMFAYVHGVLITVLFGGWIVILLGSPVLALALLVALKTAADVRAHRAERRRFAGPQTTEPHSTAAL